MLKNILKIFCLRYSVEINFDKNKVNKDAFKDPALKRKARVDVKSKFEERWASEKTTKILIN